MTGDVTCLWDAGTALDEGATTQGLGDKVSLRGGEGRENSLATLGRAPQALGQRAHRPLVCQELPRAEEGLGWAGLGRGGRADGRSHPPPREADPALASHTAPRQEEGAAASGTSPAAPGVCCAGLLVG